MAKDPAFLFYPGDFSTGTQFFSDEQTGKYIRLLMAQHQHGHLPEKHMLIICKSYDKDVFSKFVKDSDGNWYNERLEIEIIKRKNYVESRSKNKEGKTKPKIISKSYDSHMENENRNENRNDSDNDIDIEDLGKSENPLPLSDEHLAKVFDEGTMDGYRMTFRQLNIDEELKIFTLKVRGDPDDYGHRDTGGIRAAFIHQLKNTKPNVTNKHKGTNGTTSAQVSGTQYNGSKL